MADDPITSKRLIISGLTPAIDANTLSQRLASFGKVHSLVGVGMLDANGDPRNFAHLTMDTTKAKLARCIQAFSGATWKGAKLRVGEAKEDPSDRKRVSESAAEGQPPAKRVKTAKEQKLEKKLKQRAKRSLKAKYAPDMTLVTPENAETRRLWKLTPDEHLIRPMRMRPTHPLPPLIVPKTPKTAATAATKSNPFKPTKKSVTDPAAAAKKAATAKPMVRARQTIIDPTRYGACRLPIPASKGKEVERVATGTLEYDDEGRRWVRSSSDGSAVEVEELVLKQPVASTSTSTSISIPTPPHTETLAVPAISKPSQKALAPAPAPIILAPPPPPSKPTPAPPPAATSKIDEVARQLQAEKAAGLALMRSLLQKGWEVDLDELEGAEEAAPGAKVVVRHASVGSEEEDEEAAVEKEDSESDPSDDEDEVEEEAQPPAPPRLSPPAPAAVPSSKDAQPEAMQVDEPASPVIAKTVIRDVSASSSEESESDSSESDSGSDVVETRQASSSKPAGPAKSQSLKDMFAPREDEGGFSLFGNLAASGFELDDIELDSDTEQQQQHLASSSAPAISGNIAHTILTEEPVAVVRALTARDETIVFDPSVPLMFPVPPRLRETNKRRPKDLFDIAKDNGWTGGFWRTATEEEIKQRWEDVRGDLTRQFKKRHREAVKKRRRGHGTTMAEREAE